MQTVDENPNIELDQHSMEIGWGSMSRTPMSGCDPELLTRLTKRLFIGPSSIGGKVSAHERILGCAQIEIDDGM